MNPSFLRDGMKNEIVERKLFSSFWLSWQLLCKIMLKSDVIAQTTATPFLKRDKGNDAALSSNISNLLFTNLIENYERENKISYKYYLPAPQALGSGHLATFRPQHFSGETKLQMTHIHIFTQIQKSYVNTFVRRG